jgi:hypothetical protein
MIRDMAWREELRNDPSLRSFVKGHEDAFGKILKEWAHSRLEHFEKRRNLGALSVEYIFQQLQRPGGSYSIYEYMQPEDIIPYLQEAAFRTDPDHKLRRRYYAEFRDDYKSEGGFTNYNLSYLMKYMEEMAEEFTYHYIKLMQGAEGYELGATLPKHAGIFNAHLDLQPPNESTLEGKENLKAIVRLVGRFQTQVAT